jgi:porin
LASTPYGAPGVRLRVDPCEQFYAQAGVYDGLPDLKKTGTRINLNEEEGALAYFEIGYRLNQTKESTGLPGNFKLGAYLHTDEFFDNLSVFMGAPETHDNTYGVYFLADQVLFREIGKDDPAQQGLVGFFRVAAAPEDRNLTDFGIDGGLVYRGLIPTRDWDTLGVAGSYLEVSEDIQEGMKLAGFPVIADYEGVVELNYKAQMAAWWTVQASLQRVFHPGARTAGDIPDSWVLILQSVLRF